MIESTLEKEDYTLDTIIQMNHDRNCIKIRYCEKEKRDMMADKAQSRNKKSEVQIGITMNQLPMKHSDLDYCEIKLEKINRPLASADKKDYKNNTERMRRSKKYRSHINSKKAVNDDQQFFNNLTIATYIEDYLTKSDYNFTLYLEKPASKW